MIPSDQTDVPLPQAIPSFRTGIEHQSLPLWVKASIVYLLLPLVLFSAGWLKLWVSAPLIACIFMSVGMMVFGGSGISSKPSIRTIGIVAGLSLGFAILTGLCDWVPQSADYFKHNLILGDLIERSWPVRYSGEDGDYFLCYGLGYYMVPAALSKVFGSAHIGAFVFAWAALGLFLVFSGLWRGFKRHPALGILGFLLCSGLGAFWHLAKSGHIHALAGNIKGSWLEANLMDLGLYTSNLDSFTRIFYQPQHGIVGWLGGLMIYELLITRKRWTEAGLVLAATFFWSPITSLGLSVIVAAALAKHHRTLTFYPVIHFVTATAVMCVLATYYLPHLPIAEKGFIWQFASGASWLPWYLLFLLFFVLIPASSIAWFERTHPYLGPMKPVVIGMTLVLILSPLFKFGQLGDLRMQISGPAFLFLAWAVAKGLIEGPAKGRMLPYAYLAAVFLAGTLFPVYRTLANVVSAKTDYRISTLRANQLNSITDLHMDGFDVKTQYLGAADSKAGGLILKPAVLKDEP